MMESSYNKVEDVLRATLADRAPVFMRVFEGGYPFLLLITSYDVAGFVVLNGDVRAAYDSTYARFKQLYRDQHANWSGKTLSLVVCTMESSTAQAAFLSELETDVYFCRKYVIRYSGAPETFRSEIARLPFVPLPEGEPGGIIRPLSAQTLLQEMGVDAGLAYQLIVPRAYGAHRIVTDILEGKRELSTLREAPTSAVETKPHISDTTRVKSLSIQGFRAYKEHREFDLDADLVVLFGPNGLGKTSFFDALDFVCTGRIGRLCPGRISHSRFVDLARHLDTAPDFGNVALKATCQSQAVAVVRHVNDWTFAYINDERVDRTPVLQRLTSAHWPEKTPRIENIERLFRATHLFSQTDPELLSSFANKSIITADLVSRMLALDDYASGLDKTEVVLSLIEKRLTEAAKGCEALSAGIKDSRDRLQSLDQGTAEGVPSKTAERLASEIRAALANVEGVDLPDATLTAEIARDWRAMLQGALDQAQQHIATMTRLQEELPKIRALEQHVQEWGDSLTHLAGEAAKNRDAVAKLIKRKEETEPELETLHSSIKEIKQVRSKVTEAKAMRAQLPSLAAEIKQLREKISTSEARLTELTKQKQALEQTLKVFDDNAEERATTLSRQSAKQKALTELVTRVEKWNSDRRMHVELSKALKALRERQEELRKQRRATEEQLQKAKAELSEADDKYRQLSTDLSELTKLLDQIEQFVTSNVCPLCGTDHKTKGTLTDNIRAQKQRRPGPLEKAAQDVRGFKGICRDLQQSLDKLRSQESEIEDLLSRKTNETDTLSRRITSFENDAATAGFDPNSDSFLPAIQQACAQAASEASQTSAASATEKQKRDLAAAQQDRLAKTHENVATELADARSRVEALTLKQQDLERAIREAGIESNTPTDEIDSLLREQNTRLENAETQASGLAKSLSAQQDEITRLEKEHKDLASKQQSLEERRKDALRKVRSFMKQLDSAALSSSATIEEINGKIAELTAREKRIEESAENVRFLEKMLDAAAKSAEIADIESRLKEANARHKQLRSQISQLTASRKWFHRARQSLRVQRERAVESHIAAYGPLATLIQKRLRAVYGFGDIKLESKKDEIHVLVSWASQFVRPTDYFSESQKQILMVSLFLAGRLTQTWSEFAPILFDDPVTHFDDLNAYSFVELLRGLLENGTATRQFFISTCEERLFSLMRDKLANLSGGARFYQFQAMTPDGPEVIAV